MEYNAVILHVKLTSICGTFTIYHTVYNDIIIFFQKHNMHGKRKMKVSFVILAAVNLFMYVNSTEKRRITCGKRSSFCLYFYLLDSLIPSQI